MVQRVWVSRSSVQNPRIYLSVFVTALLGTFFHFLSPVLAFFSLVGFGYILWQNSQKGFKPKSDTYKELERLKKKRVKKEDKQHKHINDQIAYIDEVWGYTKEQEKIIKKFIESRAYSTIYNKLTASLLPQVIALMDNCNAGAKKGCKREVSKRLRELAELMKTELKKKKSESVESFETTLEVYDRLQKEIL